MDAIIHSPQSENKPRKSLQLFATHGPPSILEGLVLLQKSKSLPSLRSDNIYVSIITTTTTCDKTGCAVQDPSKVVKEDQDEATSTTTTTTTEVSSNHEFLILRRALPSNLSEEKVNSGESRWSKGYGPLNNSGSSSSGGGGGASGGTKILRKTWDIVKKNILLHSSSGSGSVLGGRDDGRDRGLPHDIVVTSVDRDTQEARRTKGYRYCRSAPTSPIRKKGFEFDDISSPQCSCVTNNFSSLKEARKEKAFKVEGPSYFSSSPCDSPTPEVSDHQDKIQRSYALLQKRLSQELHQRMSEYTGLKYEGAQGPSGSSGVRNHPENFSEDFKKRLQQWEMWKASTGKVVYTDEELQLLLPQEFSKKLQEWECKKHNTHLTTSYDSSSSAATGYCNEKEGRGTGAGGSGSINKSKVPRKKKSSSDTSKQKELAWLEKQLEKIEVEKKRLEREMKKYLDREARLEKMKEALKNNPKEVWIRTPTANCKVEKLTEKFTKKLYEWEERQGIQPESSAMAFLTPKYYGPPPEKEDDGMVSSTSTCQLEDDLMKEDESDKSGRMIEGERENQGYVDDEEEDDVVARRMSSASSSDFDEATDSYATHEFDKGNSGASNTDSDLFRMESSGVLRRQSSDAISTPLSARSPSLSAFTSDDDGDGVPPGMLKTVAEADDDELGETSNFEINQFENSPKSIRDAESQTDTVAKAKPVVLPDPEELGNPNILGAESPFVQTEKSEIDIFVPTKRTIFKPVVDTKDNNEKKVIIEPDLKSPFLVRSLYQNNNTIKTISEDSGSTPMSVMCSREPVYEEDLENKLGSLPPKVVAAVPKLKEHTKGHPKMGKIPVWCSPLGARRQFNIRRLSNEDNTAKSEDSPTNVNNEPPLFTIDKFLKDTNLMSQSKIEQHNILPRQPITKPRLPITSPKLSRKYTIGGGIPPPHEGPTYLSRSNSFGFRSNHEGSEAIPKFYPTTQQLNMTSIPEAQQPLQPPSFVPQPPVSKSRSAGSLRQFSHAFVSKLRLSSLTGKTTCSDYSNNPGPSQHGQQGMNTFEDSPTIPPETPTTSINTPGVQRKKGGWLFKK